jgi:hypothetical protein
VKTSCTLTAKEVIAFYGDLLWLLKEKGAPIQGSILLKPDMSFDWTREDLLNGDILFTWRKP